MLPRPAATSPANRSDPEFARGVFDSLFEQIPELSKQTLLQFLAEDIEFLSAKLSDRWGITLFQWGLRLNAGWVECLVCSPTGLRVLIERDSAPQGTSLDGLKYERAPGCDFCTLPLSDVSVSLRSLTDSHFAALKIAARYPATEIIRRAHSIGVTAFLSTVLNRPIANPSYVALNAGVGRTGAKRDLNDLYAEGTLRSVTLNRFERDSRARAKCISHYGLLCSVCGMSFLDRYGETMKGFIHVHHVVPLASVGKTYFVDPVTDLRPVCPNCHAVIHSEDPPLRFNERTLCIVDEKRSASFSPSSRAAHKPVCVQGIDIMKERAPGLVVEDRFPDSSGRTNRPFPKRGITGSSSGNLSGFARPFHRRKVGLLSA